MSDFDLKWNGDAFFKVAKKVTKEQMWLAVLEVEKNAKDGFGKGASLIGKGATIRKTKGGKRHRPSAPGFAPNIDTGILKSSVKGTVENITDIGSKETDVVGKIGYDIVLVENKLRQKKVKIKNVNTAVNYGWFLEVGTRRGLQPRPWLLPALVKSEPEILKIFKKKFK